MESGLERKLGDRGDPRFGWGMLMMSNQQPTTGTTGKEIRPELGKVSLKPFRKKCAVEVIHLGDSWDFLVCWKRLWACGPPRKFLYSETRDLHFRGLPLCRGEGPTLSDGMISSQAFGTAGDHGSSESHANLEASLFTLFLLGMCF